MNISGMLNNLISIKPEKQIASGVVVMAGASIYGCYKFFGLKDQLAKRNAIIRNTENDKKTIRNAKIAKAVDIVKAVAPTVAGEVLGARMIFGGTKKMHGEYVALAAAYATLDETLQGYRKRVAERYGEETEQDIYYGTEKKEIVLTETDENGKEKKTKVKANIGGSELSGYARYFAYGYSLAAEKNDDYNEEFIKGQEVTLNSVLGRKGYVTLNEWYEAYGYKPTIAGQAVGWVYDYDDTEHGDNKICCTKKEVYLEDERTGKYEKAYILDPNVDGDIRSHLVKIGLFDEK